MSRRREGASVASAGDYAELVSEKQWMRVVVEAAQRLGYLTYHVLNSRGSAAGFPDLICIRPIDGRLVVIETKAARGRVTPAQQQWLDAFRKAGVDVLVARPDMWGDVLAVLQVETL